MYLVLGSHGETIVTRHYRFHIDWSNSSKSKDIIPNDENTLVHLRCYFCAKITIWNFLILWCECAKVKLSLNILQIFLFGSVSNLRFQLPLTFIIKALFFVYSCKQHITTPYYQIYLRYPRVAIRPLESKFVRKSMHFLFLFFIWIRLSEDPCTYILVGTTDQ